MTNAKKMNSSPKLILIAEDSPTQALQLRVMLESAGFKVIHGKDGQEASLLYEQNDPAIVVTDVMMPNMNGFELTQFIRSGKTRPKTPVLLLTSLTDESDIIRGLASGANSFITKPFNQEYLLEKIDRLIKNQDIEPETHSILDQNKGAKNYDIPTISFLISAYQTAILKNKALEDSKNELKDINRNLEKLVQQRTGELEEAKLKAEKSDLLKSVFLSNVSHDLRTPMNAIIGFSELVKEDDVDPDQRKEYMDLISMNGDNLLNLINDIIDISKIEAGVIKCDKKSNCAVNDFLSETERNFKQFKFLKSDNDVKLFFNKANIIPDLTFKTDVFRLNQILSNLLSNAIKFTKRGSIEFSYQLLDEHTLMFYVKDTGIGIPKDKISDLFQRYEQVKTSDSPTVGTGLGLAIADSLVRLLGGNLWVDSELGKGSTFSFVLPYEPASGPIINYNPKLPDKNKTYDFNNQLVLVVEDDKSNYNYLHAVLKKANVDVLWAKDGEQAIELFKTNPSIRLILMDINLPKMSGFDVTRKILGINNKIPIIAQTAYAMSGDEQMCYDAGCIDYLAKPIKPLLLLSKLEKQLL